MLRFFTGLLFVVVAIPALASPVLNSATLPNARVVPLADTATIFMTTLNTGDVDATNCMVVKSNTIGSQDVSKVDLEWALTGPGGVLVGNQNDPFTIAAGGLANLVLGIARGATAGPFDTLFTPIFHVECDGGFGSSGQPAVNGALIQFSDTRPDIIPIVQTFTADGIANFDDNNRLAVVSVAAVNNSAAGGAEPDVGVSGEYLGFKDSGQFNFMACETDPATGACLTQLITCAPNPGFGQPCFTTKLGATAKTFAFFVILPPGEGALFAPGVYRFAATFRDQFGVLVASSSVALNSSIPVINNPPRPNGQYEMIIRNTADLGARTVRQGVLTISDKFISGRIFRTIDQGFFIQIFEQYFREPGSPAVFNPAAAPDQPQKGGPARPAGGLGPTEFNFFNDDANGSTPDGVSTTATLTIERDEKGGTISFPDDPLDQAQNEPGFLDVLDATQADFIKNFRVPIAVSNTLDASLFTVSSGTDAQGAQQFDTPIVPGPGGGLIGASWDLSGGCTVSYGDTGTASNGPGPARFAGYSVILSNCPAGDPRKSFENTEPYGNVEASNLGDGTTQLKTTFVLGNPADPNGAFIEDIVMRYTPPPAPDAPQKVRAATPAKSWQQSMAQEIANERAKPVYWHMNGKDVLMAVPQVSAAAGSGD